MRSIESTVTIGIPVVNEIEHLPLAIRSVFAQTRTDWQLVIMCDGASEDVLELVMRISDERVRVVSDGDSLGLPTRLNQVTHSAETPLVCRMDADDVMHPERLARQISYFERHPETDVLGTQCYIVDEFSTVRGLSKEPALPLTPPGYLQSGVFFHPSVIFSREWASMNPYDPEWLRAQDKELWLRANHESRFAKLDEPSLFYRIPQHLSLRKYARSARWDRKVLRNYAPKVGVTNISLNKLLGKSWAKQFTMAAAIGLRMTGKVYARRFRPMTGAELEQAYKALSTVRATEVPGWDT